MNVNHKSMKITAYLRTSPRGVSFTFKISLRQEYDEGHGYFP